MSIEVKLSADQLTGISGQSHQTVCGYGFTGTTLSYDAQYFPFLQVNGDIVQCLYFSGRSKERETFMLYIYQIIVIHLHYSFH